MHRTEFVNDEDPSFFTCPFLFIEYRASGTQADGNGNEQHEGCCNRQANGSENAVKQVFNGTSHLPAYYSGCLAGMFTD
jgi:hypothetical protein